LDGKPKIFANFFGQMIDPKLKENFPSFSARSFLYVKITKHIETQKYSNLSKVGILSFNRFLNLNFVFFFDEDIVNIQFCAKKKRTF